MADTTRDITLRLEGKVDMLISDFHKLDKSINGNGTPGLKTDVGNLIDCMQTITIRHKAEDEKTQEVKTRKWDMQKGVALLSIAQFLSLGGLAVAIWIGLK